MSKGSGTDSLLAPNAKIIHLIEGETGRSVSADHLLSNDEVQVHRLYHDLHVSRRTGKARILCEVCGVAVYLVASADKRHFHFRHFVEDGSCPAVTRGKQSEAQINALRYHGQRESAAHFRLKHLLRDAVDCDPQFAGTEIEGTWKGKDGKERRRPDVRSRYCDQFNVAFEVQLSTTFGRVMAEREVFYKSEGALLLWVFGEFSVDRARLMMEVIFAHNNRNAFIVSEASLAASECEGTLILECCWHEPRRSAETITWSEKRQLVRFDQLTIDRERQRAFFVDTDALEREIQESIKGPPLHRQFGAFWLDLEGFDGRERPSLEVQRDFWVHFQHEFSKRGALLPERISGEYYVFSNLMRAMLLAKLGRAVGWSFGDFIAAAHHVLTIYKGFHWIFIGALQHFGRLAEIEAADRSGNWAKKMEAYRQGALHQDPNYREDHRFDDVLRIAFPELAAQIPDPELPF